MEYYYNHGLPCSSAGKEFTCNAGDPSSIPGLGRSPGEQIGYPLQYSWASLVAQLKRICLQCRRPQFNSRVRKVPWRRDRLPTPVFLGLSGGSDNKESTCNVRDLGLNPGLGRSLGGGHGNPLQYSCLENPHGGLQSMGLQRVGHNFVTKHSILFLIATAPFHIPTNSVQVF